MKLATVQKASLAVLAWWLLHFASLGEVYRIAAWPPEKKIAAILEGRYAIDAPLPLPMMAVLLIYGAPTVVVGALVWLYRKGTYRRFGP